MSPVAWPVGIKCTVTVILQWRCAEHGWDIKKHDQRHIEYKPAEIVLHPAINQPIWTFARQLAWGSWAVTDGCDARRI
jgi:hypothetical protein